MGFDGSTWEKTAHSMSPVWITRIIEEEKKREKDGY